MSTPHSIFEQITADLTQNPDVVLGKMMSAPGLKYKDSVFAFFHKGSMTVKLGNEFDAQAWGLTEVGPLSPFKTKPPLKDWLVVDPVHQNQWPRLAELALERIKLKEVHKR